VAVDRTSARRVGADRAAEGRFRLLIGSDAKTLDGMARARPTWAITKVADQMMKMLGI
jgi:hypothetical protein